MKAAKIISFIAFISNSSLSIFSFNYFLKLYPMFKDLEMPTPFPWPFLFALIFAIGSLVYWFYLRNKERKGEKVRFALWVSIALWVIPFLAIVPITSFTYTQPIYEQLQRIR
jgi:hypothetical protein